MTTTTIRVPDDLKARIAAAAEQAGKTVHAFMLEAIAEKIEQAELRSEFSEVADARFRKIVATGKTIPWEQVRRKIEQKIAALPKSRPAKKKLAR